LRLTRRRKAQQSYDGEKGELFVDHEGPLRLADLTPPTEGLFALPNALPPQIRRYPGPTRQMRFIEYADSVVRCYESTKWKEGSAEVLPSANKRRTSKRCVPEFAGGRAVRGLTAATAVYSSTMHRID
jgi:hypothetical protein